MRAYVRAHCDGSVQEVCVVSGDCWVKLVTKDSDNYNNILK